MFTTLVLSAAGMYGVMYVGGLRYLYERDMHRGIRTIIGSSAGALVGFMLALGLTPDEMDAFLYNVFCNIGIPCISLLRLFTAWWWNGVLGSQWKKEYIRILLKKKLNLLDINFTDFAKLTGKDLVVVGYNITQYKVEYFSVDTTPTMSVIEALDISTNIPFVFRPTLYNDDMYVDGGVYNYLPTDVVKDSSESTLVMYCPIKSSSPMPKNLFQFLMSIMFSLTYMLYHENSVRFPHSIALTTGMIVSSVDTLTLRQRIITFPRETVDRLLMQGYDQVKGFVELCCTDVPAL
jgi:predicted acylesterase/phospholipase RssA